MMFAIAMVRQLILLPGVLILVLGLYGLAQLPLRYLLKRLTFPGIFILSTVLLLPWTSGQQILWQWGGFALRQEGTYSAALVSGRFLSILILGFILLGTTPFLEIVSALRSLRMPPLLTDMTLLTYRYLFEVAEQLVTMKQAMALRGYGQTPQPLFRRWHLLSNLLGSLLLRSYDQSQRVYQAMRLRGYGQDRRPVRNQKTSASAHGFRLQTRLLTGGTVCASLGLVTAEWMLSR